MDDWQLIETYARENSESAFRALVERHAALVQASALRQTGDAQLAEDISQAVFTLLARKAVSLRRGTLVAGWLFQTTRFVAARALRSEQRRRRREQESFDMQQLQADDEAWRRMAPVIDDALSRLGASDREAILLRYVEGRSLRDVSGALGVSEEAAKKRVTRALEKLRHGLVGKGVAVTVTALGAALSGNAAPAAPAGLIASLTTAGLGGAGGTVTALASETLATWRAVRLKWMGAAAISSVVVAVLLVTVFREGNPDGSRGAGLRTSGAGATNSGATVGALAGSPLPRDPSLPFLRLKVLSGATDAPVTNAPVVASLWQASEREDRWNLRTDAEGVCEIAHAPDALGMSVGVFSSGWAARYASWPSEGLKEIPAEYTLRLTPVTNVIGGVIRNLAGVPLAGAEILFLGHDFGDSSHRVRPRERFGFDDTIPVATTDAEGRWSLAFIPPNHPGFQLKARHGDYADTSIASSDAQRSVAAVESESLRRLWAGRLSTIMEPAYTLTGTVVDEGHRPIAGARIHERGDGEFFTTDGAGKFRVPKRRDGPWQFTVTADGFGPVHTRTTIGAKMAPVEVTLGPGALLRLRVIDEDGVEVPDAEVGLEQWGVHRDDFRWQARTDFNGRLEWPSAPPGVEMELFARKEGFCYTRDIRLKAGGEEHTIELHHQLELFGRVVDAETGRAIRDPKAVPGYGRPDRFSDSGLRWFNGEMVRGTNGLFRLVFQEKEFPWQVRVTADGYDDWVSNALTNRIQGVLDIALQPTRPENSAHGVVMNADGSPAGGAQVALLSFEHNVDLKDSAFRGDRHWIITAGPQGEFSFPGNRLAHSVAAVTKAGYVHQRLPKPIEPLVLRLQPWGRVEGVVDASAATLGISNIRLYDPTADNYQGRVSLLNSYFVDVDANRRFVFESVPAGEFCVFVNSRNGIPFHHKTPVVVTPGETTRVIIEEKPGTRVTGRFLPPSGQEVGWTNDFNVCQFYADLPQSGQFINPGPKEERPWRELDFWTSAAGREHVNNTRVYSGLVREDGTFMSIQNLPPGRYRFSASFRSPGGKGRQGSVTRQIVVPEDSPAELPLGDLPLK